MIYIVLQKAFVIGDEHREYVLREAGKLHRAFRTKIAKIFLKDSNGDFNKQRPAKYSYCIKQEHWDNFVAQRMSIHFQVIFLLLSYRSLMFYMLIVLPHILQSLQHLHPTKTLNNCCVNQKNRGSWIPERFSWRGKLRRFLRNTQRFLSETETGFRNP